MRLPPATAGLRRKSTTRSPGVYRTLLARRVRTSELLHAACRDRPPRRAGIDEVLLPDRTFDRAAEPDPGDRRQPGRERLLDVAGGGPGPGFPGARPVLARDRPANPGTAPERQPPGQFYTAAVRDRRTEGRGLRPPGELLPDDPGFVPGPDRRLYRRRSRR